MRRGIFVFLGGGLGATARAFCLQIFGPSGALTPVLAVNLIGAFLIGGVFVFADEIGLLGLESRLFAAVGLLGGFTTFSTFAWGADVTVGRGNLGDAGIYIASSLLGGVFLTLLGMLVARAVLRVFPSVWYGEAGRAKNRLSGDPATAISIVELDDRADLP